MTYLLPSVDPRGDSVSVSGHCVSSKVRIVLGIDSGEMWDSSFQDYKGDFEVRVRCRKDRTWIKID